MLCSAHVADEQGMIMRLKPHLTCASHSKLRDTGNAILLLVRENVMESTPGHGCFHRSHSSVLLLGKNLPSHRS